MSAVAEQQRLPLLSSCSEQEEPKTSSSIFEFLNQEQQCWSFNPYATSDDDCASEVDIDGIFDEINRLSGRIQESRSVDEILQEAETLILSQAPIQLKCVAQEWSSAIADCVDERRCVRERQAEAEEKRKLAKDKTVVHSPREKHPAAAAVSHSKSESYLSKVSSSLSLFSSVQFVSIYNNIIML